MSKCCCIICGGPESCNNLNLDNECYVICADSGYNKAVSAGIRPNLVIGDFDSITGEMPSECEIISASPQKDDTDTLLAVKTALSREYEEIILAGACSGRTDHTLANIATLLYIKKQGAACRIIGDENKVYALTEESLVLNPEQDAYLSVFSVSEKSSVSISGAEYELDHYAMEAVFPIGVSNEFTKNKCTITAHSGTIIVMIIKK